MNESKILFCLLRHIVCGEHLDTSLKAQLSQETLAALFRLAAPHDLLHLAGRGLEALGMDSSQPMAQKFHTHTRQAIFRYARLDLDLERICAVLEREHISYIPLKGSVLRQWYPEPWMRTSSDIDILIKREDLETTRSLLEEKLRFSIGHRSDHDISLFSPSGTHLELHFSVESLEPVNAEQPILSNIWQYATAAEGSYQHHLSDDMFYFYHIAHMAKHFLVAECGIRPILDLWILNHRVIHNRSTRTALLQRGKLLPFAQAAEALADVWFSCAEPSSVTEQLERYILQLGSQEAKNSAVAVGQQKTGGKLRFLWNKIFPSFSRMAAYYPSLKKYPWLLPVYAVRRWCRLLFTRDSRRALETIKINATLSDGEIASAAELMQQLGLSR